MSAIRRRYVAGSAATRSSSSWTGRPSGPPAMSSCTTQNDLLITGLAALSGPDMPGQEVIRCYCEGGAAPPKGWIRASTGLAGERQGADQAVVAVEVAAAHAEPEDVAGLQVERGRAGVVKAAGRGCAAVDRAGALELLLDDLGAVADHELLDRHADLVPRVVAVVAPRDRLLAGRLGGVAERPVAA